MRRAQNALALLFFLVALVVCVYAIQLMTPVVGDYMSFARPTTLAFLRGETNLYDSTSPGFFNAPWALAIWMPFVAFPYAVGQSAHELVYILCLLISVALLAKDVPRVAVLFAVFNIPAFVLVVAAGIDSFVLLGVVLAYIAARRRHPGLLAVTFFILATKPQSVLLVSALCLFTVRDWKPVLLPVGAVLVSGLFAGLDWPLRYLGFNQAFPPLAERRIELWTFVPPMVLIPLSIAAVIFLGYAVRKQGFGPLTFSLALATNLVFSPYVLWAHFVLLVPVILFTGHRDWRLAALVWLSSWLLPQFGMLYPIVALLTIMILVSRDELAARLTRVGENSLLTRPGRACK